MRRIVGTGQKIVGLFLSEGDTPGIVFVSCSIAVGSPEFEGRTRRSQRRGPGPCSSPLQGFSSPGEGQDAISRGWEMYLAGRKRVRALAAGDRQPVRAPAGLGAGPANQGPGGGDGPG